MNILVITEAIATPEELNQIIEKFIKEFHMVKIKRPVVSGSMALFYVRNSNPNDAKVYRLPDDIDLNLESSKGIDLKSLVDKIVKSINKDYKAMLPPSEKEQDDNDRDYYPFRIVNEKTGGLITKIDLFIKKSESENSLTLNKIEVEIIKVINQVANKLDVLLGKRGKTRAKDIIDLYELSFYEFDYLEIKKSLDSDTRNFHTLAYFLVNKNDFKNFYEKFIRINKSRLKEILLFDEIYDRVLAFMKPFDKQDTRNLKWNPTLVKWQRTK